MVTARLLILRPALLAFACTLLTACDSTPGPQRTVPAARPLGPRTVAPDSRPVLDGSSILEAARPSIVVVESLDRRRNVVAQGSGVLVADKTVVTTWPLVSRAFAIRVRLRDDTRLASLSAVLESRGLARLRVDLKGRPIPLGRDTPPGPGSTAYSAGYAQGLDPTIEDGIITDSPGADAAESERIVTARPLGAGFAGGGLLSAHGELIGILASSRSGESRAFAIPVRYVKDLLALPEGALPQPTSSPLLRLPAPDRQWLVGFMTAVARGAKPLTGLSLDRVNALLDRLDPLVGAELDWVKVELGLGLLRHQRVFWEDAIEARTFGRFVKSARRVEVERSLLALRLLTQRDVDEADRMMRAIAAHEPFDVPGARIDATERYLTQMVSQVDQVRRRVEVQLWEARSR